MASIKQLYDLQKVDLELDWRRTRLVEIDRLLGDEKMLKSLKAGLARLEMEAQRTRSDQMNLDLIINEFDEKITQSEAKLYGGQVKLTRELQDLQADIEMIKRQRGEQEDLLLVVLDQVDEARKAFDNASAKLSKWEAAWHAEQQSMGAERAVLNVEMTDLQANRDLRATGTPGTELALYEQVRKTHQGKAVAVLRGSTCDACRVGIPNRQVQDARISDKPVRCPHCGLILLVE